MTLQSAFKAAAQTAFTVADSVLETVTYRSKTNASADYDPVDGEVDTDAYTAYSVKMLIDQNTQRQIDGQAILAHDDFLLIPVDNLTPTPKLHDQIIRDSEVWDIVYFETDPAQALWTFQVRRL